MSQKNWRKCVICNVQEHGNDKKPLFFATFPLDKNRCREWLKVVGDKELVYLPIEKLHTSRRVCGDHFEKKDFNRKKNRLKNWAVPKLNLNAAPLTDEELSEFPQHMWNYDPAPNEIASTSQSLLLSTNVTEVNVSISGNEPSSSSASTVAAVTHKNVLISVNEPSSSSAPTVAAVSHKNELILKEESGAKRSVKRKCDEDLEMTPRKRKLIKEKKELIEQLRKTRCTLSSMKKSAKIIENIESPVLKQMIKAAVKNQNRKLKGRRWTIKNKISALAIFKRSPKTYKYLRNFIPLPSVKTLQNVLTKIPMAPGINQAVINHLTSLAKDKLPANKICGLLFDEVALKRRLVYNPATDQVDGFEDLGPNEEGAGRTNLLADHALVFMLQGLHEKFKQPIAFYFVKGTISSQNLSKIIKDIIRAVGTTGYKVITTICDQGPTNMGALKHLKAHATPSSDNFFTVENEKIFIMYDIPHVFKSIRNNFLSNGTIIMDGKKAKWKHLVEVEEKNRSLLYLSKISPMHIDPKYRAKMKVKLAAQILSNTVSAVLKLISQAEKDPTVASELMETALVIQELDRLFDCTNGPSGPDDIKKGYRENVSAKTNHLDQWAHYIKMLNTFKFVKNEDINTSIEAKKIKCIQGYIISLKSLRDIWFVVSSLGYKYLNLRQLNQDALENLFGLVRQHSPTNRNPTCAHFMAALKTAVITRLTAPHSRGSNCEKDKKVLLTDFHNLIFERNENQSQTISSESKKETKTEEEEDTEFPVLNLPEEEDEDLETDLLEISEQPIVYISGFIASRLLKYNNCNNCEKSLKVDNPDLEDATYSYIKLREWWSDRLSLTYPTKGLCQLIQQAIHIAENEICSRLYEKNICQLAITLFMAKCDTSWYGCNTHKDKKLNEIYVRLGHLFIRRQCQKENQALSLQEEPLADRNKKAQQQGLSKYIL